MVAWQVASGGGGADPHVLVQFHERDEGCWRRFAVAACGVASPLGGEAVARGSEGQAAETPARQRSLSLAEAYHALAVDLLLDAPRGLAHYWDCFSTLSADFQMQFVAYQHFRRLGWRVKSGLNYGAHFVLYRGPASRLHSEYIVYIQAPGARAAASWNVVQALTRVAADVKKTVLLCEVEASLASLGTSRAEGLVPILSHGTYEFHERTFTVDAVAIRFWDVGDARLHAAEASTDAFDFTPQPVVCKREPRKAKPKRRLDIDTSSTARRKPNETQVDSTARR